MDSLLYILGGDDGHTPVLCDDVLLWGPWFQKADRQVAFDRVGMVCVSTVFLGLNHRFDDGPPLLFETLFYLKSGVKSILYATWDEALKGHQEQVARLREAQKPEPGG